MTVFWVIAFVIAFLAFPWFRGLIGLAFGLVFALAGTLLMLGIIAIPFIIFLFLAAAP